MQIGNRDFRAVWAVDFEFAAPAGELPTPLCMVARRLRAKSGRNQPSNTRTIFVPAVWYRGLIQAPPGGAVAYIDWSQQEFGIAAALSGDAAMAAAYASGDPYLAFARQAGAVPADATKESHALVRDQYKSCVLAVQYGSAARSCRGRRVISGRGRVPK